MKYIELECAFCKSLFKRLLKQYTHESKKNGPEYKAYCSRKCMGSGFNTQITFNCETCGKESSTEKCNYNNVNHHFCSRSCSAIFSNKSRSKSDKSTKNKFKQANCKYCSQLCDIGLHASSSKFICHNCKPDKILLQKSCKKCLQIFAGGYYKKYCDICIPSVRKENGKKAGAASAKAQKRRSKNEIYFAELCAAKFNNIEYNEPLFIDKRGDKWDADIIIHDIKVAVLWNGNWHYIPIGNKSSLIQIQNRDKIKLSVIKNNGYYPYVIEDRGKENKTFVEEQFLIFNNYLKENKFGTIS